MPPEKKLKIYLVSDASGETVNIVSSAALSQFEGIKIEKFMRPLTRNIEQIDQIIDSVEAEDSTLVLYTMTRGVTLDHLLLRCKERNIPCICPIWTLTEAISSLLQIPPTINNPSKYQKLDKSYYSVIDSMNFAIQHDDGQNRGNYNNADIVIIGTSRSSKSPTSLYLSKYGYKVANLPFIPELEPDITDLDRAIKIGLTIAPDALASIREKRCYSITDRHPGGRSAQSLFEKYASIEKSRSEVIKAVDFFMKNDIPIVDVTRKAIEEISAEIINIVRTLDAERDAIMA